MQYAISHGASRLLAMDLICFCNLSQVKLLSVYFGCRDVNNGEDVYRILGLGQIGYTIFDELILNDKFFIPSHFVLANHHNLCVFLYFLHFILFHILYTLYFEILYAFYTHHILRFYTISEQTGKCQLLDPGLQFFFLYFLFLL
jgi:hypothetical protein